MFSQHLIGVVVGMCGLCFMSDSSCVNTTVVLVLVMVRLTIVTYCLVFHITYF